MLESKEGALVVAWLAALLLLTWHIQLAAAADIISSSKLELCTANGAQVREPSPVSVPACSADLFEAVLRCSTTACGPPNPGLSVQPVKGQGLAMLAYSCSSA